MKYLRTHQGFKFVYGTDIVYSDVDLEVTDARALVIEDAAIRAGVGLEVFDTPRPPDAEGDSTPPLTVRVELARAAAEAAAVSANEAAGSANTAADTVLAFGDTQDAMVAGFVNDPASDTGAVLSAAFAGRGVGRFLARAQSGENLTVTVLGDSMWAGQTVTNPATDGAAILLANDLSARFPGTVTVTNRAFGGRTMLTLFTFSNVEDALADKADLYIIGGGRNDALHEFAGAGGDYKEGYPRAGSLAARERLVRMIRDRVPKADIMLTSESPYKASTGVGANAVMTTYYEDVERLAAQYGCEYVDVFAAVLAVGNYDALMADDGVHPNTAGHRFMADRVLDHLPVNYRGAAIAPGKPGNLSIRKPGEVDATKGRLGYVVASTASVTGLTLTKSGGGWSGTAPHVTTTATNYIEYAFTGTELHVNINNTSGASPVVFNVSVDGATVATNVAPDVQGIAYYYPLTMGLSVGAHTVRITLVSGTLSINQAAALVGPGSDVVGGSVLVDLTGTVAVLTLSTSGTASYAANEVAVPLPAGWAAMDVDFSIWLQPRVTGETTTWREFQFILRRSTGGTLVALTNWKDSFPPVSTGIVARKSATFTATDAGRTASQLYRLEAYATGTDKTSQFIDAWKFTAVCRRIA